MRARFGESRIGLGSRWLAAAVREVGGSVDGGRSQGGVVCSGESGLQERQGGWGEGHQCSRPKSLAALITRTSAPLRAAKRPRAALPRTCWDWGDQGGGSFGSARGFAEGAVPNAGTQHGAPATNPVKRPSRERARATQQTAQHTCFRRLRCGTPGSSDGPGGLLPGGFGAAATLVGGGAGSGVAADVVCTGLRLRFRLAACAASAPPAPSPMTSSLSSRGGALTRSMLRRAVVCAGASEATPAASGPAGASASWLAPPASM